MKNQNLLNQVDPDLRRLFVAVDARVATEILPSTIRTKEQQLDYFTRGVSKTMDSKHLIVPGVRDFSEAVDAGPYPMEWPKEFDWSSIQGLQADEIAPRIRKWAAEYWKAWARLYHYAGIVRTVAEDLKIGVRFGGNWDGDFDLKDQNFYDAVHYEKLT